MAAMGAANRDGDMFFPKFPRLEIPLAKDTKPPAEINPAIGSRGALMRADREKNPFSRPEKFFRDLHP
jgi:hypothetical protein